MYKNIICYGKNISNRAYPAYDKGAYFLFDLETFKLRFEPLLNLDNNIDIKNCFNETKYVEMKKKVKNKPVYTVLAEVYYDGSNNYSKQDLLGYLVINDEHYLTIVKEVQLLNLIQKYNFMNFHYSEVNGKGFFKKNPGVEIQKIYNQTLKDKLGYSFDDYNLKREMTGEELSFCMQANEFKLGYMDKFYTDVYGKKTECLSEIFVNSEGIIIILNMVRKESNLYDLGYFGTKLIAMRHVNSKKYFTFLKKNPYLSCSTFPIDGTKTDITIFENNNDYQRFFNLVKYFREFSKPCKPFYCSKKQEGFLTILPMLPKYQYVLRDDIDTLLEKEGYTKADAWEIRKYLEYIIGYRILKRSDVCLEKWYANYHISMDINEFLAFISNEIDVKDNKLLRKALQIYLHKGIGTM